MNEKLFIEIKNEILNVLSNSRFETEQKHAILTYNWVLKLKPDANYELQIAALAHDIERGVYDDIVASKFDSYDDYKKQHSLMSANEIKKILLKYNLDEKFISKVYNLVLNHEIGGDDEVDILKDADSISYFQDSIEPYSKRNTIEKTKFKIKYMFDRASPQVQKIVKELEFEDKELGEFIRGLN